MIPVDVEFSFRVLAPPSVPVHVPPPLRHLGSGAIKTDTYPATTPFRSPSQRLDVNFAVDWALKTNYLSIYPLPNGVVLGEFYFRIRFSKELHGSVIPQLTG